LAASLTPSARKGEVMVDWEVFGPLDEVIRTTQRSEQSNPRRGNQDYPSDGRRHKQGVVLWHSSYADHGVSIQAPVRDDMMA
jgi:hypothetical protein